MAFPGKNMGESMWNELRYQHHKGIGLFDFILFPPNNKTKAQKKELTGLESDEEDIGYG